MMKYVENYEDCVEQCIAALDDFKKEANIVKLVDILMDISEKMKNLMVTPI